MGLNDFAAASLAFLVPNYNAYLRELSAKMVGFYPCNGVPNDGTSGFGAGKLGLGALVLDVNTGTWYGNFGSLASPTWHALGIQSASLTLTSAQVKNLRATPISIVAAPGANLMIQPIAGSVELVYGGTNAFTAANSDNLGFKLKDGTTSTLMTGAVQAMLQATASDVCLLTPSTATNVSRANAVNQPLVVHNTTGAEIAGNAAGDNQLVVKVKYVRVVLA